MKSFVSLMFNRRPRQPRSSAPSVAVARAQMVRPKRSSGDGGSLQITKDRRIESYLDILQSFGSHAGQLRKTRTVLVVFAVCMVGKIC